MKILTPVLALVGLAALATGALAANSNSANSGGQGKPLQVLPQKTATVPDGRSDDSNSKKIKPPPQMSDSSKWECDFDRKDDSRKDDSRKNENSGKKKDDKDKDKKCKKPVTPD